MPRIHILPDILASQVAAGEVVERPASAIKELVENSLDAGAREILVEIRRGGASLLRVIDDGSGMSRDDAMLSLERHATSKLSDSAGLAAISTLGFRGEAVPSIASVSRFRLLTREPSALAGTEIQVDGGVVREVRDAGCAPGTTVEVRDLFFNVPARRKFLRAETTEAAHIEHQLRMHALAAPAVRFRFRKDERESFDLPGNMSRLDRVRWMLGNELGRELIAIPRTTGRGLEVEGFILPALHARKGRRHQCVFLNGRPVEDAAISRGLAEGFRGALADGMHPAAWLWIELEPNLVDVNVHPAKREIRLHRPLELKEAISQGVREALAAREERKYSPPAAAAAPSGPSFRSSVSTSAAPAAPPRAAPARREWPAALPVQRDLVLQDFSLASPPATTPLPPASPRETTPTEEPAESQPAPLIELPEAVLASFPSFRMIGTLHSRFALLESDDGLVLMDPRAACERILYERWLKQAEKGAIESQFLLVPLLLEPGPREAEQVLRQREGFSRAGIEIEDFGSGTLRIGSMPAFLTLGDPRPFLMGLIDDLVEGALPGSRPAFEHFARIISRRAAIAEAPNPEEAAALLPLLFACDLPYCAPDGRPTLSEFSLRELERRFAGVRPRD